VYAGASPLRYVLPHAHFVDFDRYAVKLVAVANPVRADPPTPQRAAILARTFDLMKTLSIFGMLAGVVLGAVAFSTIGVAQNKPAAVPKQYPCLPAAARTSELGCWLLADEPVGPLPSTSVFWHLDKFPTLALAEKAKELNGTALEALGHAWLLTIAEADWRPKGGEHVAVIGPLLVDPATKYKAEYLEGIMNPGTITNVHRHPGPEAFYTESGEACLETPEGKQVGRQGVNLVLPARDPMQLTVTGTEQRRSLVLILYDAAQPWMVPVTDWTPKGLCAR
jgi:quercetin dioxygenase-like cupin family protein